MPQQQYLVVGGSSGIGLALTRQLAEAGHHITVLSRTSESLTSLSGVEHIEADITTAEISSGMFPDTLHGLVYCPGSINLKPFRSLKPDHFREDFEINFMGAVKVLQATQKALQAGNGSVVLFSTVAVTQGMPYHASVAAAKGAIEGLTRSLAAEWAPKIRVNCIAPSLTDTPMAARLLSSPEKREASADRHPLKAVGKAEDVAAMAAFLLSDSASWMSGQIIGMDGGMSSLKV